MRLALGGGWNEIGYAFAQSGPTSPWDRSEINGVRCMKLPGDARPTAALAADLNPPGTTGIERTPVSDEVFAALRINFVTAHGPSNAHVESKTEDAAMGLMHEVIRMPSPASTDELILHIYTPKDAKGPYPPVVFFGGLDCLLSRDYATSPYLNVFDFVPKSGRAFVFPEYKTCYSRNSGNGMAIFSKGFPGVFSDWAKEVSRVLDYLEERPDLQASQPVFVGLSLGSAAGTMILPIESRFKAAVLISGGLIRAPLPEDAIIAPPDFIRRIHLPLLLLAGKYDYMFPVEDSQNPFMEILGTPAADKRHVVLEAGHVPLPRLPLMNETLAWLDKYQPVAK
jgi:pimeloyl-ACP methyl ester carboxylesterase